MIYANVSNDSLAVLIKDGNMEILDVVKYKDPLVGKIGGLEINPLYSMLYSTGDRFCFSGTVSLINSSGEIVTLQMNEELSPGVKLIALNPAKAVFEKGEDSYLVIDFKNVIRETSEPF